MISGINGQMWMIGEFDFSQSPKNPKCWLSSDQFFLLQHGIVFFESLWILFLYSEKYCYS